MRQVIPWLFALYSFAGLAVNESCPSFDLEAENICEGCEKKGAFFGVPRDHQDQVGTCFANTAKNLIVSLSGGTQVPSFLELAALGNNYAYALASRGLDGGSACQVLEAVKQEGFCPQKFSPAEMGETNPLVDGFFSRENPSSVSSQASLVRVLKKFLMGKELAREDKASLVNQKILTNLKSVLQKIHANPQIKIPHPVVRFDVPGERKMLESFYHLSGMDKSKEGAFIQEYRAEYKKFYPRYFQAVGEGKGPQEIFNLYREIMTPLYGKYNLNKEDVWKKHLNEYVRLTKNEFASPTVKKDFAESDRLVRSILQVDCEGDCYLKQLAQTSGMLQSVKELDDVLVKMKQNPDKMFNGTKLKSDYEIIMLALAPSCLNKSNRGFLSGKFFCDYGYEAARNIQAEPTQEGKRKKFREMLKLNLSQGFAVGNSMQGHANTFVGMKFDPKANTCLVKVRESQTGTSDWISEDVFIQNSKGFMEARPCYDKKDPRCF